ncbi:MAG: glycosyltransferase family 1 protein [Rhodospirillales bacterium]|nr:glycosyltransferase family 1 protein [Rhodospirillales bacterium]
MSRKFPRSNKIRVLVNGIHAKSGGGVTYLRNILPLLADDDDLDIHLILHRDQSELYGNLSEKVRVHPLEFDNRFFPALVWEQLALPVRARSMSADVTFSPANYGPLFAPNRVIVLSNSLAVFGRETRLSRRLYWIGLALMTGLSLLTCTKAIAVSRYARNALTFGFGSRRRDRVTIVNHGVNPVFSPDDTVDREPHLLAVSDIYIKKNIHTLIEAMATVHRRRPEIKLKIAGRSIDAGYMGELRGRIAELGLAGVVEFLGEKRTDELVDLYRRCLVFVFPSTVETFGIPLIEAMACGAPIACSNTAAMPEIVGDAAEFFSPLDAGEMASRILAIADDPALRRELGLRATKQAAGYSWSRAASETADVIKNAARGKMRRGGSPEVQAAR